jgi:hypothetical protein
MLTEKSFRSFFLAKSGTRKKKSLENFADKVELFSSNAATGPQHGKKSARLLPSFSIFSSGAGKKV